ncbi:uncharacterized protein LOC124166593 isoform X2 [Ischnura elegans]|nr:uncharacterized protein LOC124166593 isoform X2 [Ischnura elegans]
MIDPLKAHLSAKSFKCQKKVSQKKEMQSQNKSTSELNNHHHSTCSRAYRHSAMSHEGLHGEHSQSCISESLRSAKRKKCPSKVTTVIESIPEPCSVSADHVLLQPVKDSLMDNTANSTAVKNCEVSVKSGANVPKSKDVVSPFTSFHSNKGRLSGKNTKAKTKKKKLVADNNAKSLLFQLCASSENEEDSYSSYMAIDPLKSPGNVKVNHSASLVGGNIPHVSDNCKRCHLKCTKSLEHMSDKSVTQKIECLIKGGKNLLSTWNEDNEVNTRYLTTQGNHKSSCGERKTARGNFGGGDGSNKFGMYLINEHDEVEDTECGGVIVTEDDSETLGSWREVDSKTSPCVLERRASIFRVDIRKKDSGPASESSQEGISFKGTNNVDRNCCKESKDSCFCESMNEEIGFCGVPMDGDCQVMKNILETLCIDDGFRQNEGGVLNRKRGKCLRNTLENLLAVTEVDGCPSISAESLRESKEKLHVKELFLKPNSHNCSTGKFSSKFNSFYPNGDTLVSSQYSVCHQGCGRNAFEEEVLLSGIPFL